MSADYERVRSYCEDLSARLAARAKWRERHPDHGSEQYRQEEDIYWQYDRGRLDLPWLSTFDPLDPEPQTSDLLTSEFLAALMSVTIAAFDTAQAAVLLAKHERHLRNTPSAGSSTTEEENPCTEQ